MEKVSKHFFKTFSILDIVIMEKGVTQTNLWKFLCDVVFDVDLISFLRNILIRIKDTVIFI